MIMRRCLFMVFSIILMTMDASAGYHIWSQRFGDSDNDLGLAVAVDRSGSILITGWFFGTVNLGGEVLTSAGDQDIFIAKYDVSGNHLWSKQFGDSGEDIGWAVAVDGNGNVLVTGSYRGTVDFGGGPLMSAGGQEIFLAKYDVRGNHIWSLRRGTSLSDGFKSIAVDDAGSLFLSGWFDTGDGPEETDCILLAKYDSEGNEVWSQYFSALGENFGNSVALDGAGNVIMTGMFFDTIDFGGGVLTSAGGRDLFLAKFNPAGSHIWSHSYGDFGGLDMSKHTGIDGSGNIYITGCFGATVDFGGGPLVSAGEEDGFVAKYNAAGSHVWSRRFGGSGGDRGNSIAIDEADNVIVSGCFSETADFDGDSLVSAGSDDIFVAKYDSDGNHVWSQRFGDTGSDWGFDIAVDPADNVLVTGWFMNTVDFGGGPLVSAGERDIFVAKFGPAWTGVVDSPPGKRLTACSYPNPFNPRTTIAITLPEKDHVILRIYDVNGRVVTTLYDGMMSQGFTEISWDGTNSKGARMSSGVYFYSVVAGTYTQTKKMVLLK